MLPLVHQQCGDFPGNCRHRIRCSQFHLHRCFLPEGRCVEGKIGKAVVQQTLTGSETVLAGFRAHHHSNKLHSLPPGRSGQTVSRAGSEPSFQPRASGIKTHHLIGIGKTKCPIPDSVHPDGGVFFNIRVVFQQLPAHDCNIIGGGSVFVGCRVVIQAGAVDKIRVIHSQFPGPGIHQLYKSTFRACQMLCHGAGAIVGRRNCNGLDHIGDRHGLSHLQIYLAAALGRSRLRSRNRVLPADLPGVNGLHNQQHGHHFGY